MMRDAPWVPLLDARGEADPNLRLGMLRWKQHVAVRLHSLTGRGPGKNVGHIYIKKKNLRDVDFSSKFSH